MKINEIFYSIQGEGKHTGRAAVFIRFAGCNLKCDFCDTDHVKGREMSQSEILEEVKKYKAKFIVLTGGEPTLQVTEEFVDKLHEHGYYVAMETNGTNKCPDNIDWITCSPKYRPVIQKRINELKVVYQGQEMSNYEGMEADEFYLQPCDYKDVKKNKETIKKTIDYIKENPRWKISIQTQKVLNIR